MVSDVVKWLTKWSPAHLSFAMHCTIHLNYLRSGKHTLCGIQRSCEKLKKQPQCIMCEARRCSVIFHLLHDRRFQTVTCAGFVWRDSRKINGQHVCGLDRWSRFFMQRGVKLEDWCAVLNPGLQENIEVLCCGWSCISSYDAKQRQREAAWCHALLCYVALH